jgi:hypothetical protein
MLYQDGLLCFRLVWWYSLRVVGINQEGVTRICSWGEWFKSIHLTKSGRVN